MRNDDWEKKEVTRIWTEEDARVFQRQTHGLVVVQLKNEWKAFVQMCVMMVARYSNDFNSLSLSLSLVFAVVIASGF